MPELRHEERSLVALQAQHLTDCIFQDRINQSELVYDHAEAGVVIASYRRYCFQIQIPFARLLLVGAEGERAQGSSDVRLGQPLMRHLTSRPFPIRSTIRPCRRCSAPLTMPVIRSSAVGSAASKPLQVITARAISKHDRGCSVPLSDPRTSRGNSCRPNQSQLLRLGLLGRISSGSASGNMSGSRRAMRQVGAELVERSPAGDDLAGQLGALAGQRGGGEGFPTCSRPVL